jgi:two-component system sensor histidine kinase SenX3
VADDGVGIPREQQDRIFERFYRVDVARTGGGTGLGLSIVRHIAERHGATVEVTSAVGVGSRFGVHFPSANGGET